MSYLRKAGDIGMFRKANYITSFWQSHDQIPIESSIKISPCLKEKENVLLCLFFYYLFPVFFLVLRGTNGTLRIFSSSFNLFIIHLFGPCSLVNWASPFNHIIIYLFHVNHWRLLLAICKRISHKLKHDIFRRWAIEITAKIQHKNEHIKQSCMVGTVAATAIRQTNFSFSFLFIHLRYTLCQPKMGLRLQQSNNINKFNLIAPISGHQAIHSVSFLCVLMIDNLFPMNTMLTMLASYILSYITQQAIPFVLIVVLVFSIALLELKNIISN